MQRTCHSLSSIYLVDLGIGNIGSVKKMIQKIGRTPIVLDKPPDLTKRHPILIPGVGHFSHACRSLIDWKIYLNAAFENNFPILGICLGAQLMCDTSEEGYGEGLGWLKTTVCRFPKINENGSVLRVPHMGWQPFTPSQSCFAFPVENGKMYYAHSFYIKPTKDASYFPYQLCYGGICFAAAVQTRCALGVQFHPEKSHHHGMAFLRNWIHYAESIL